MSRLSYKLSSFSDFTTSHNLCAFLIFFYLHFFCPFEKLCRLFSPRLKEERKKASFTRHTETRINEEAKMQCLGRTREREKKKVFYANLISHLGQKLSSRKFSPSFLFAYFFSTLGEHSSANLILICNNFLLSLVSTLLMR